MFPFLCVQFYWFKREKTKDWIVLVFLPVNFFKDICDRIGPIKAISSVDMQKEEDEEFYQKT